MMNPFADIKIKPEADFIESSAELLQKTAKKNEIYSKYDPLVNEVLDLFIATHRQGMWEKDSDCSRRYCCHIAWFAGPKEKHSDPYDKHHTIRRRIEVTLEMDGLCNPTGFTVSNHEAIDRIIHVGLEKDDLVRGIKEVMG
jgi:hypothetical protein